MATYSSISPSSPTPAPKNDHSNAPSPAASPRREASGPPRLSLDFDRLTFDGNSSSLGVSSLDFVKSTIPSEPSYDMVDSDSSCDKGQLQGSDYLTSPGVNTPFDVNLRLKGVDNRPRAETRYLQLDGVSDERFSRPSASSPKYTNPISNPRSGGLQVRNGVDTPTTELESPASSFIEPRQHTQSRAQEHRYIPYNPHSRQPLTLPPSTDGFDERSLPSENRLFDDFDGVHCEIDLHLDLPVSYTNRPMSYAHLPPLSQQPPQPPLVYYPAPVPAMLNLPPQLAKPRSNRESQILSNRKSIAGFPLDAADGPVEDKKKDFRRSLANLPPQLRASVFFDQPLATPEVELKEESAVATLDSILDAAAKSPPVAFTEHPIAAGPAFQRPDHARSRSSVMLNNRQSVVSLGPHLNNRHSVANLCAYRSAVALVNDDRPYHQRQSSQLSLPERSGSGGESHEEHPQDVDYGRPDSQVLGPGMQCLPPQGRNTPSPMPPTDPNALPTTLLAELEARKVQLRSRNRTAATAFPTGMRSTLLELDAVAQVQKKARAQKRTNLAWENPDDIRTEEPDEDVPLGLLYAGANHGGGQTRKHDPNGLHAMGDEDIPLGLIVKREIEDNEPLSKRKERLKGPISDTPAQDSKRATVYIDVPGIDAPQPQNDEEVEDETLAERLKRMREQKEREKIGFGTGSLGLSLDDEEAMKKKSPTQTLLGEREETLGQRRRRLQQEKDQREKFKRESIVSQQEVRQRNMMDIIQHQQNLPLHLRSQSAIPGVNAPLAGGGMLGMGGGSPATGMGMTNHAMGVRSQKSIMMGGGGMGMPYAGGVQMQMQAPMQNAKQMEMVERWRSSVMGGNPS
ncbi:hypothetical protein L211DRAFT_421180 [Terfezia boudieri ATCC MYA-4762]|uniref:Uncharacterized protein n=1 Tax=Terfezia boudieri ATCC MYA-4762 TaxID=1051890 RepID=A0A3N4LFR0_9PEZI|nr:hypothetical protein L211DRAFT_421180 [Terfezia boudieri ATCC MYA-4762]